jgi:tryptophan-rich sensory protein
MNTQEWYAQLEKPSFAPPNSLFGPVWSVLYVIILCTFGYVFYLFVKKKIPFKTVLPFLLNLIFNVAFSPIQFGLKNNYLALIDIFLVLVTLIWAMRAIYQKQRWISLAQIPYLMWVSFATILQVAITYLNI